MKQGSLIYLLLAGMMMVIGSLSLSGCAFYRQFGQMPEGVYLEKIRQSPHYDGERFNNLEPTPMLSGNDGFISALFKFVTTKNERAKPTMPIPTVKTDLKAIDIEQDTVIWLGHSSFYIQLAGKRLLIDPVLNDYASPVSFANQAFDGTSIYTADDIPEIDVLLITHDHWDHLDYDTVLALKPKIKRVVTGLGVGSHFRYWGYSDHMIEEADWNDTVNMTKELSIHVLPARHFSGRTLTRDKTLWVGFALETPDRKLFFSGDSGYGQHFSEIGKRFGGFDFVFLDSGQYDNKWRYIHMTPEDASQAAEDLQAKAYLPAHTGRFSIAYHSWDDPFIRAAKISQQKSYRLITPMIGELIELGNTDHHFTYWWEAIQ